MPIVITFVTIMAWLCAICGPLLVCLRLYAEHQYANDKALQAIDEIYGRQRVFPIATAFWVSVISIVFLIAKAIS
jgi:hypothetical protein